MSAMNPEDELAKARMAVMSPSVIQHPMHAMIAPISAPEPPPLMMADDSSPDINSPAPSVRMASPLERYQESVGNRMSANVAKDERPQQFSGKLGTILHGLNEFATSMQHAQGKLTPREAQEQKDAGTLENIEKEKSAEGYQDAQTQHLQAETPEIGPNAASTRALQSAQIKNLESEAKTRDNPQPQYGIHDTPIGPLFINMQTGSAQHLSVDGQPVGPKLSLKESQPIMGDDGKPHTYMLDDQGRKVVDLGVHYERPITVNTGAGERADRNAVLKAYEPTQQSAERMNVMTDAYEKAITDHDQQAMLNLLANHLGMTMGLQKGARMTRDIIREAQESQPWLASMKAKFDKDGYLSGVTLSPQQMRQMVSLGQQRYIEDAKTARATGKYLGAKDDGPDRVPGDATLRYYLGLTKGDANKARELLRQDGWTY